MSPVLLDHRNLKWIGLSVVLLALLTFFGGYITGFEKSNNKWMARLEPVEITLPDVAAFAMAAVEAQPPEVEEPGANIDVDSVDDNENIFVPAATNPDAYSGVAETAGLKVAMVEPVKAVIKQVNKKPAEPAQSHPKVVSSTGSLTDQPITLTRIVDDADAETAQYSIQVGMYSSFDNADSKVTQLLNSSLNAYLHEYQNKNDEMRYNVRFGYFASFASAQQALNFYRQSFEGAGYIARIER